MPCDSRENPQHDQSSQVPSASPLTSLIHQVFAIPLAIYERGVERGDEWRQWRNQHSRETDGTCNRRHHRGAWRREDSQVDHSESSDNPYDASPIGNGDDDGDDWVSWLKREAARGERRAKEMYDSWDANTVPEKKADEQSRDEFVKARDFIDELEKSHQRNIEKLYNISANSAAEISEIPVKAIEEFISHTRSDPAHSALWNIIPNLLAFGAHSWDPDDASSIASHMISYAMWSPYSPIHLEQSAGFDGTWKARFEDLIRAEKGQPLLTKEEIATAKVQKSSDWLETLIARYGDVQSPFGRSMAESKRHLDAETELDAYDKIGSRPEASFLRDAIKRHKQSFDKSWSYIKDESSNDSGSVTSLTRTVDTHTQPDGSLITKTVIHRIFQDGREEKTENIAKSLPPSRSNSEPSNLNTRKEIEPAMDKGSSQAIEQSRRGWFWSK